MRRLTLAAVCFLLAGVAFAVPIPTSIALGASSPAEQPVHRDIINNPAADQGLAPRGIWDHIKNHIPGLGKHIDGPDGEHKHLIRGHIKDLWDFLTRHTSWNPLSHSNNPPLPAPPAPTVYIPYPQPGPYPPSGPWPPSSLYPQPGSYPAALALANAQTPKANAVSADVGSDDSTSQPVRRDDTSSAPANLEHLPHLEPGFEHTPALKPIHCPDCVDTDGDGVADESIMNDGWRFLPHGSANDESGVTGEVDCNITPGECVITTVTPIPQDGNQQ